MGRTLPFGEDDQRYVEIWNLVFMQFDRSSDGVLVPLPKPSIDTGMGLERIACVLQGVLCNYQTDLFTPLIERAAELVGHYSAMSPVETQHCSERQRGAASLRIIADHARAATFLISDGVFRRMKDVGMCCGRFCGVGFGMDGCWGRRSRLCMRWFLRFGMRCRWLIRS